MFKTTINKASSVIIVDYQNLVDYDKKTTKTVKIWGQLIEIVSRDTGIYAHWGDTVSYQVLSADTRFRMDLRLLNHAIIFKGIIDVAIAEFSKEQQDHKYYKDMLKTVFKIN
ncbi:hypothetical protein BCV72DRAFT_246132 [Rhizopus microsporus var. microsporus]|uniref:Uncharacterized protein n=1 Tax=Rhizopus microsporus var. microsporus TaxID=86635 RepID=A0A1X0QN72_RHIZD|nr:hypothetical protein BCV72DRAFT_246132 [Rhizopus microsporus var. microsporus]